MLERMVKQRQRYWINFICLSFITIMSFGSPLSMFNSQQNMNENILLYIAIVSLIIILIYILIKYFIEKKSIIEDVEYLKLNGNKIIGRVNSSKKTMPINRAELIEYYLCTAEVNGEVKIFKSLPKRNYKTNRNVGELCIIYYDENGNYFVDVDSDLKDN